MNTPTTLALGLLVGACLMIVEKVIGGNIAYRITYMFLAMIAVFNAWILWKTTGKSELGRTMVAVKLAIAAILGWWWFYNYMDRPAWLREGWYWIFLTAGGAGAAYFTVQAYVLAKAAERIGSYMVVVAILAVIAIVTNAWYQEMPPR